MVLFTSDNLVIINFGRAVRLIAEKFISLYCIVENNTTTYLRNCRWTHSQTCKFLLDRVQWAFTSALWRGRSSLYPKAAHLRVNG